jgi:hypothetical protein
MEKPPKIPLNYQPTLAPHDGGGWSTAARFFTGLFMGSVVSGIVWPLGWGHFNETVGMWILLALIFLKLLGMAICFNIPRCRPVGVGLLVSIAAGGLIFFGTCASHL